ncbi:MAG: heparinase II/III family protein [Planctomycetaceae bacterium]|nr:heparinase II/III family protein [Planctomycetaceae bacterium]
MTKKLFPLCLVCVVLSWTYVSAEVVVAPTTITLPEKLPEHPRLFFTKQKEAEIKELMKTDQFLEKLVEELIKKADRVKNEPPTDYQIPDGVRLLGQSRRSIDRTTALAFAYRMTGNKEYADAAITEMLTVCRFDDWNPSHYLDVAEMATAVALGYDWLYDVIPEEQRKEIRDGLLKHALATGFNAFRDKVWWTTRDNNWNEVCNTGLLIAALAIIDDFVEKKDKEDEDKEEQPRAKIAVLRPGDMERAVAHTIVNQAINSIPRGLSVYAPDGAYPEGPGYWAYGTWYTGLMLMVLRDVFQDDFGLSKTEGLTTTGDYYMSMIGPRYYTFNHGNNGVNAEASPMIFALSHLYDRPDYAVWLRTFIEKENRYASGRGAVFHALWYNPKGTDSAPEMQNGADPPLAQKFAGKQDIAMMRTAWNDPNAAFLAIKGGNNQANHTHLDIGSFVYEVNGVRWAVDVGADNYNLPDYFGVRGWNYFRKNNRSHNTLVIGDKIQNPAAECKIIEFASGDDQIMALRLVRSKFVAIPRFEQVDNVIAIATVDMTDAYKDQAVWVNRSATLYKDGSAEIEDFVWGATEPIRWGMMTQAEIEISEDGKTATLSQRNQKIRLALQSGAEKFEIVSATPPTEVENQNRGYSMITTVAMPRNTTGTVRIRVVIRPEK